MGVVHQKQGRGVGRHHAVGIGRRGLPHPSGPHVELDAHGASKRARDDKVGRRRVGPVAGGLAGVQQLRPKAAGDPQADHGGPVDLRIELAVAGIGPVCHAPTPRATGRASPPTGP